MPQSRYYYLHAYNKEVRHASAPLDPIPEGFEFCGLSQMPIKGAAGYYTKNQSGYAIVDADEPVKPAEETANGI